MKRTPSEQYLEKAKRLGKAESERLLSRARNKLLRRLEDQKVSPLEAVAIQLELEEEALAEWRERWAEIKDKFAAEPKTAPKAKSKEEAKPVAKAKAQAKPVAKAKAQAKPATQGKVEAKAAEPKAKPKAKSKAS